MDIIEKRDEWMAEFEAGWLKELNETGKMNWSVYTRPKNTQSPAGKAIDLSKSKLMLITTAGTYLPAYHEPFNDSDDTHPLGDYSIRHYPTSTNLDELRIAHSHYPHDAMLMDPQVLVPLRHLEDMVAEGIIGSLAPSVVSYAGYQPVATAVVDELLPPILRVVEREKPDAVLLVPS